MSDSDRGRPDVHPFELTPEFNWEILEDTEVLKWANIGSAYWNVSLDRIPENLRYKKAIRHYIRRMHDEFEPQGTGLFLHGPFGSGKTSLACLVLMCCLAKGGRSFFIRATELIRAAGAFKPHYVREGVPTMKMAYGVNMLAIDDVELDDPKMMKCIEGVMRERDDNDRPTIITANLKPKPPQQRQDDQLRADNWLQSVAAQRLISIRIVGPEQGGLDWRKNPPQE